MKVIYFNGSWFTNVGEAFVDIGGLYLTKKIFPNAKVACISSMTDYYYKANLSESKNRWAFLHKNINEKKDIALTRMSDYIEADYVVLPGLVGALDYLDGISRAMVDILIKKGAKVIFLGLGGWNYSEAEVIGFSKYLEQIKPAFIMTRDKSAFNAYKDVAPCISGIDCAFWSIDSFDPRFFISERCYDVVTFNRSKEPDEFKNWANPIVRPMHMQYSYRGRYQDDGFFISDTPYDYLTLYANAHKVYTDLVHATIVSLMYGTPVKNWRIDRRAEAFEALDGLCNDGGWLSVSEEALSQQKSTIISKIQAIIKD